MDEITFWKSVSVGSSGECWSWNGKLSKLGYGRVYFNGRDKLAHVVAYQLTYGNISVGFELDHTCRNRSCCNPKHLEPVSHKANVLRGISPSAMAAKKTHCPKGHPYDEENTYINPSSNARNCRICSRVNSKIRMRKYRAVAREIEFMLSDTNVLHSGSN